MINIKHLENFDLREFYNHRPFVMSFVDIKNPFYLLTPYFKSRILYRQFAILSILSSLISSCSSPVNSFTNKPTLTANNLSELKSTTIPKIEPLVTPTNVALSDIAETAVALCPTNIWIAAGDTAILNDIGEREGVIINGRQLRAGAGTEFDSRKFVDGTEYSAIVVTNSLINEETLYLENMPLESSTDGLGDGDEYSGYALTTDLIEVTRNKKCN